jgi:hypothetical protein
MFSTDYRALGSSRETGGVNEKGLFHPDRHSDDDYLFGSTSRV